MAQGKERRLVGVDLGIAAAHTAVVMDSGGRVLARRKCIPTVGSLSDLETAALDGAAPGTVLEVVVEPTGSAWLPLAVFFNSRGHVVYRVSSAKAADLRRFLSRHAKSNGIDAETLARLPIVDPAGLYPLELPGAERAALDRRVRAVQRLTQAIGRHKVRIKDLVRQLLPVTPLHQDLNVSELAVLARTGGDPHGLVRLGVSRLAAIIAKASKNQLGRPRAEEWIEAARAALELYGDHEAVAFSDLADEVRTEVKLLQATMTELEAHAAERERCYRWVDPRGLARSLPGVAEAGGPVLVAAMGRPGRFPSGAHFKAFTGLTARASETGDSDRKGEPMSKAGPNLLRWQLVRSADTARTQDPQLAAIYFTQMVERGATHTKALCVVAARLAERAWTTMQRGMPYVICDTDGHAVTPQEAKAIIAAHFTVPDHVRRRRRSKKTKTGKAPHEVLAGHQNGARGALTRRPSPPASSTSRRRPVKTT